MDDILARWDEIPPELLHEAARQSLGARRYTFRSRPPTAACGIAVVLLLSAPVAAEIAGTRGGIAAGVGAGVLLLAAVVLTVALNPPDQWCAVFDGGFAYGRGKRPALAVPWRDVLLRRRHRRAATISVPGARVSLTGRLLAVEALIDLVELGVGADRPAALVLPGPDRLRAPAGFAAGPALRIAELRDVDDFDPGDRDLLRAYVLNADPVWYAQVDALVVARPWPGDDSYRIAATVRRRDGTPQVVTLAERAGSWSSLLDHIARALEPSDEA